MPIYNLTIAITDVVDDDAKNLPEPTVIEVSRPFTEWFDASGLFVAKPFQEFIVASVPLVARYDPKRVNTVSQELLDADPALLDAVLKAGEATGTDAKKGGKRRKN